MRWTPAQVAARENKVRRKYGANCFEKWGELGGNPVLIQQGIRNRAKRAKKNS